MRVNIYLPDDLVADLDRFAAGRSRSAAVRDAILLAVRLGPVLQRLDRIEARLSAGPSQVPAQPTLEATDVLRRTIGAEPPGFIDDD